MNGLNAVEDEFEAALHAVAVVNRSHFGRVEVTGKDALDLLHRLSTNDLLACRSGQTVGTVFTNDKGRVVDFVKVVVLDSKTLIITSPGRAPQLIEWVNKYCIMEDISLTDVTSSTAMISLIGPNSTSLVSQLFGVAPSASTCIELNGPAAHMVILRDCSFHSEIIDIIVGTENSRTVMDLLTPRVKKMGQMAYEAFRITRGIPASGTELSDAFNPFEVGLRQAISFSKGCYLGQEVIARLDTYGKVQRKPIGLVFDKDAMIAEARPTLYKNSREIGWRTSISNHPIYGRYVGLGIVKKEEVEPGDLVVIDANGSAMQGIVKQIPISLNPKHEA
jgi:hypothetical protein